MLDTTTIAANPGFPLVLANHRFTASDRGELLHFVESDLRATVPPEGWDDYVKYWPAAIDVVRQLRAAHLVQQAQAARDVQGRMDVALAAIPGADRNVIAAVKTAVAAALGAPTPQAAAAPDPMTDPTVQAALAVLKAKGFNVAPG